MLRFLDFSQRAPINFYLRAAYFLETRDLDVIGTTPSFPIFRCPRRLYLGICRFIYIKLYRWLNIDAARRAPT